MVLKLEEAGMRMIGYGLKYFKRFQFTHLGKIGKES